MDKMEIPKELKPLIFFYDLNERELEIFLYLAKTKRELNADELSETLKISRSCIMGYIKTLENKGFVLKKRDIRVVKRGKPQYVYFVNNEKIKEKILNDIVELMYELRKSLSSYIASNNQSPSSWSFSNNKIGSSNEEPIQINING